MDSKELQGLLEAYTQVHTTQEVDEAVKGASPHTMEMRKGDAADRKAGIKPLSAKKGEEYAKYKMSQIAHSKRKRMGEEVEQIDEVSADLALKASKAADIKRGKLAAAGDKEGAAGKAAQASRLYKAQADRRLGRVTPGKANEEVEQVDELYKGKHGQSETEYQDSRSNAGKMVSGTSKLSGAAYSYRGVKNTGPNPAGGSQKPQGQGRMTSGQRTELQYRKANLMKKEELDIFDVVLEFLQVEGYAETLEEAEWLMANELDAEDIKAIIETRMDPRGRPSSGPMNVYAKNKPNTDPKFQAALQAVRDADAKKTPEQRQKELDAYKARQANR